MHKYLAHMPRCRCFLMSSSLDPIPKFCATLTVMLTINVYVLSMQLSNVSDFVRFIVSYHTCKIFHDQKLICLYSNTIFSIDVNIEFRIF